VYILILAVIGAVDGLVWFWRFRAGAGSSLTMVGWSTMATTIMRSVWLMAGVGAFIEGRGVVGCGVYCVTATAATCWAHARAEAKGA